MQVFSTACPTTQWLHAEGEPMNGDLFILLGSILLLALGAHGVGRKLHVPRVTLLLLLGVAASPAGFDFLPPEAEDSFGLITNLALAMVGFLLGERMALNELRHHGGMVMTVSLSITLVTSFMVFLGVWAVTGDLVAALLLAGIAPATDAAATLDVINESGARGTLTDRVWGVVAVDDAWCILLFSVLLVTAESLGGNGGSLVSSLQTGLWELGGAVLLGLGLGLPMAWLTGRLRKGEPMVLEAVGFVLLCAGIAQSLHLSYLLACMVLGAVVANNAHHHLRPFRSIHGIADPFLAIFFFLAGYRLEPALLLTLGAVGAAYLLMRLVGRIAGAYLGARMAGADRRASWRMGWCLLPQAGVAMGLALVATERVPQAAPYILPLAIGSTVVFEVLGPLVMLWHLRRAGEIR